MLKLLNYKDSYHDELLKEYIPKSNPFTYAHMYYTDKRTDITLTFKTILLLTIDNITTDYFNNVNDCQAYFTLREYIKQCLTDLNLDNWEREHLKNKIEKANDTSMITRCDICDRWYFQEHLFNLYPSLNYDDEIVDTMKHYWLDFDGMVCERCYNDKILVDGNDYECVRWDKIKVDNDF